MLTTALHLQTDKSHLTVPPINETELSWLISSIFLSGSAGILFVGWLGDFFGRKRTMCMLSIAHIVRNNILLFFLAESFLFREFGQCICLPQIPPNCI